MSSKSLYRPLIRPKDYGIFFIMVGLFFMFMMDIARAVLFNPFVHLFVALALLALGTQLALRRSGVTLWAVGMVFFAHTLFFAQGIYVFDWFTDLLCGIVIIVGGIAIQKADEMGHQLRAHH